MDTPYDSTYITREYDGVADVPDRPNPVALANAAAGSLLLHPHYESMPEDIPAKNITTWTNAAGGTVTDILIPTRHLPMLQPMRDLGLDMDWLQAILKPQVDSGYSRNSQQDSDNPKALPTLRSSSLPTPRARPVLGPGDWLIGDGGSATSDCTGSACDGGDGGLLLGNGADGGRGGDAFVVGNGGGGAKGMNAVDRDGAVTQAPADGGRGGNGGDGGWGCARGHSKSPGGQDVTGGGNVSRGAAGVGGTGGQDYSGAGPANGGAGGNGGVNPVGGDAP